MKTFTIKLLPIFVFFLIFSNCKKNEIEINNTEDFEAYIQEEMEAQNIPALAALIFKKDEMLYENYFGLSQIEQDIPLENDHLFLLASISKTVTATALMQLQEAGHFDLDDKINEHLSFSVQIPDYTTDITFRMLLTHTSAIADGNALDEQYYFGEDSPVELAYFLENYLLPNGEFYNENENFYGFEPGTEHEYSNTGNTLIGLLVEQIAGQDFDDYCQQNIFTPLGMTNTSWRLEEISQTIVQPYNYLNGEYEAIEHYTFTDYPNGGLRSTGRDLFTFMSAFVQDETQLLNEATINDMISPQIPSIDNEVGLHLFLLNPENNLWGHDGGEQGVATIAAFNPTTKVGVIILTNQGEANLDEMLVEAYQFGLKL